jgi:hypothetical protein
LFFFATFFCLSEKIGWVRQSRHTLNWLANCHMTIACLLFTSDAGRRRRRREATTTDAANIRKSP